MPQHATSEFSKNFSYGLHFSPRSAYAATFFAERLSTTSSPLTNDRISRAIKRALSTSQNEDGPVRIDLSSLSLSDEAHIKNILLELRNFQKPLQNTSLVIVDVSHNTFSKELLTIFQQALQQILLKDFILYTDFNAEDTKISDPFPEERIATTTKRVP